MKPKQQPKTRKKNAVRNGKIFIIYNKKNVIT